MDRKELEKAAENSEKLRQEKIDSLPVRNSKQKNILIRSANKIIHKKELTNTVLLSKLINWAGENIADFVLRYDDFVGRWEAEGVYLITCQNEMPHGATALEAMADLVFQYYNWLYEIKS